MMSARVSLSLYILILSSQSFRNYGHEMEKYYNISIKWQTSCHPTKGPVNVSTLFHSLAFSFFWIIFGIFLRLLLSALFILYRRLSHLKRFSVL